MTERAKLKTQFNIKDKQQEVGGLPKLAVILVCGKTANVWRLEREMEEEDDKKECTCNKVFMHVSASFFWR